MALDINAGTVLPGGYRIDERIGSGGMGVVYRAVQEQSGATVAIKMLRAGTADRRFREEGKLLAELDHPGLVSVLDEGEHDGSPFLVLAYVSGPTLRDLLALGPLQPGEVARIGAAIARTLAYVHSNNIVHRDVKPSNILITEDGKPVLNDFGVSYRYGRTRWTESGFVNGTAAYLAPEQVLGEPPAEPIDVYALGLVLLECLSGFPEYDGDAVECAVARLHRTPRPPRDAPEWLAAILLSMTATDPNERPTAAEAAALLAGEQLLAGAPDRGGRARTALLAAAAAVAAAGLVAAVWLPSSSPAGTTGEPLPTQVAPAVVDPSATTGVTPKTTHAPTAETVAAHGTGQPPAKVPPAKAAAPAPAPAAADKAKGKTKAKGGPPPGHGPGSGKGKGKHAAGSPSSDPAA
jgi:eukaryotic-like serine/threonine-protein kinase